jgi:hypothetical protein
MPRSDIQATRAAKLDGSNTNTARASVDEHGLPRLCVAQLKE